MSKTASTAIASEEPNMDLLTTAPPEWDFETVSDVSPTAIEMELNESVVLYFEGVEHIVPDGKDSEPFDLLVYTGRDGEKYSLNPSYKLERYFRDAAKAWYRITLVKEVETGRGLNSMKDYRIEKAK